jgi:hypothetical protein
MMALVEHDMGPVDLLVNNAAVIQPLGPSGKWLQRNGGDCSRSLILLRLHGGRAAGASASEADHNMTATARRPAAAPAIAADRTAPPHMAVASRTCRGQTGAAGPNFRCAARTGAQVVGSQPEMPCFNPGAHMGHSPPSLPGRLTRHGARIAARHERLGRGVC